VVIALASLRLAPVQCTSFGHTATSMSPAIDYMIVPEDFVGTADCFSEKLIALPKEAMPFLPPRLRLAPAVSGPREGPVRIAIAASVMKLNARLLDIFKRIAAAAKTPVEFRFLPAFAVGLAYHELARAVRQVLPNAVVYAQAPYPLYLTRLAECDLFLCPFPYGNMNGIVDAIGVGLPGVCLDGAEAHAHADAAFFARIGFPRELVARTADEYVAAALRLVDDTQWRTECRQIAADSDLDRAFFQGDASLFCQAVADLVWPPSQRGVTRLREPA
jgi:predicted O-linked N-acetylglucosamine transferase (SPINDLY family)